MTNIRVNPLGFSEDSGFYFQKEEHLKFLSGNVGHPTKSSISKLIVTLGSFQSPLTLNISSGSANIFLGDNCRGSLSLLFYNNTSCVIGNDCSFNSLKVVADINSTLEIGNDCMFSNDTSINLGDLHDIFSLHDGISTNTGPSSVKIGDHVWMGRFSQIICSSRLLSIGKGSIIGSHSLVTKEAFPYSLLCGIPAKTIKSNVSWNRSRYQSPENNKSIIKALGD